MRNSPFVSPASVSHSARRANHPMLTCRAATSASLSPPLGSLPDPFRGRLLGPPPADQHWWDALLFAGPLVLRTGPEQAALVGGKAWRMYYHGRDTEEWGKGVCAQPGTPFGRVGLAVSSDGITWERYHGPLPGGAVFDPSDDPSAFDSVHVGCSDVLLLPDGTWLMLYYAGANRRHVVPLASFGPKAVRKWEEELRGQKEHMEQQEQKEQPGGQKEDICAAGEGTYSADGGETWEKAQHVGPEPGGPILQPRFGEEVWDNLLVGTPHLVVMGEGVEGGSEEAREGKCEGGGEEGSEGEGSGRVLLYYTGVGEVNGCGRVRGIGAAVWDGGETGDLNKWRRLFVD
ncbi:unnamed protein product [Closterium sp. NIES-53]